MSREIDLTQPLSDEDAEYLLARGREQEVLRNAAQFDDDPDLQAAAAYVPGTVVDRAEGVPPTPGGDPRVVMGGGPTEGEPSFEEDDEDGDLEGNYETWTKRQLEAELGNRELSTSGNKSEMIARLREDDEDDEDEDEDTE